MKKISLYLNKSFIKVKTAFLLNTRVHTFGLVLIVFFLFIASNNQLWIRLGISILPKLNIIQYFSRNALIVANGILATIVISILIYIAQIRSIYKKRVYFYSTKIDISTVMVICSSIFFLWQEQWLFSVLILSVNSFLLGQAIIRIVRGESYIYNYERYLEKYLSHIVNRAKKYTKNRSFHDSTSKQVMKDFTEIGKEANIYLVNEDYDFYKLYLVQIRNILDKIMGLDNQLLEHEVKRSFYSAVKGLNRINERVSWEENTDIFLSYLGDEFNRKFVNYEMKEVMHICSGIMTIKVDNQKLYFKVFIDKLYGEIESAVNQQSVDIKTDKDFKIFFETIDILFLFCIKILIYSYTELDESCINKIRGFIKNLIFTGNIRNKYRIEIISDFGKKRRYIDYSLIVFLLTEKRDQLKKNINNVILPIDRISPQNFLDDIIEFMLYDYNSNPYLDLWESFNEREYNRWVVVWDVDSKRKIIELFLFCVYVVYKSDICKTTLAVDETLLKCERKIRALEKIEDFIEKLDAQSDLINLVKSIHLDYIESQESLKQHLSQLKTKITKKRGELLKQGELSSQYIESFLQEFNEEINKKSSIYDLSKLYLNEIVSSETVLDKHIPTVQNRELFKESSTSYSGYARNYVYSMINQIHLDFYKLLGEKVQNEYKPEELINSSLITEDTIIITNLGEYYFEKIFTRFFISNYQIDEIEINDNHYSEKELNGLFLGYLLIGDKRIICFYLECKADEKYVYCVDKNAFSFSFLKPDIVRNKEHYTANNAIMRISDLIHKNGNLTDAGLDLDIKNAEWLRDKNEEEMNDYLQSRTNISIYFKYKIQIDEKAKISQVTISEN